MTKIDYGIESIKFAKIEADGAFPDFDAAGVVSIEMIDIDTVTPSEEANSNTDVEFENYDSLRLPGTKGVKSITFTSSNKDNPVYKAFKGMKDGAAGGDDVGWLLEDPDHDDTSTWAMQITTKALGPYPAKIKQYTPVLVEVKETDTTGRNNLGKFSFTCTRQPNFGTDGKKLPNYREKSVPVA